MKKLLISLLLLLPLTGCIYESYDPELCPENSLYYLSFVLNAEGDVVTQDKTKATEGTPVYDIGSIFSEQLVKEVDLYFYDYDGKFQAKREVKDNEFTQNVSATQSDPIANVVGDFTVALGARPYRMLVALNMRSAVDLSGKSIAQAMEALQQQDTSWCWNTKTTIQYKGSAVEVTPFRMTSSAYVSASGQAICDHLIPDTYLFATKEEAETHPMNVYIDRMAVKVTLFSDKTEFDVPAVTPQDNIATQVKLLAWGLNALNRSSYHYKNIDAAWNSASWAADWNTFWNDPQRFRSYWAKDPNYTVAEHVGIEIGQQQSSPDADKSYFQFPGKITTPVTAAGTSLYCLENTADAAVLPVTDAASATFFSRSTHILVKAQLKFRLAASATGTDVAGYGTEKDFFRYKGVFYTKKNLLAAVMGDTQKYYKLDGSDRVLLTGDDVEFKKVSEHNAYDAVIASYDRGERVCIVPKVTYYRGEETTPYPAGTYLQLPETSGEQARIDGFKDGIFYYAVPIEHLNEKAFTGSTYPVGYYGVVRNHVYEVTLSGVAGIGTGIWDDSYDIRPFRKAPDLVSMYVKIYPWKEFSTRFVFADPSGMLITNGQMVDRWEDGDLNLGDDWITNGWYF